jgi:hypothetical protein
VEQHTKFPLTDPIVADRRFDLARKSMCRELLLVINLEPRLLLGLRLVFRLSAELLTSGRREDDGALEVPQSHDADT